METVIYLATVVLTVTWSVWNNSLWKDRMGLSEESPVRFLNLAGPSIYFLLVAMTGWQYGPSFRLDFIGLAALDAAVVVAAPFLVYVSRAVPARGRRVYLWVFALYNVWACAVVIAVHSIRRSPLLLIRLAAFLEDVRGFDLFNAAWGGIEGGTGEQDLAGMVNKIMIALFTYLPVSAVRLAAANKQRARLRKEIDALSKRVQELEDTVRRSSSEHSEM